MDEAQQYNLRPKRKLAEIAEEGKPAPKKRKSPAQYQRAYRQRIKDNPELYKLYRACETERVKECITNLTEEKKAQYRKVRLRVQKFRQRHAAEPATRKTKRAAAPKTRVAKEAHK